MVYIGEVFIYNVEFIGNRAPNIASMFLILNSKRLILLNSKLEDHTSITSGEDT